MSKVAIQGNASGTGTFTIAAPNSNTDRTLTLPDEAGTVLTSASDISLQAVTNAPFFLANMSGNQSISNATFTKIQFSSEAIDSHGWYDSANYRFTPQVAGWYRFTLKFHAGANNVSRFIGAIGINGTNGGSSRFWDLAGLSLSVQNSGTYFVLMNGSTDYVEPYAWVDTSGSPIVYDADGAYFGGELVRAT